MLLIISLSLISLDPFDWCLADSGISNTITRNTITHKHVTLELDHGPQISDVDRATRTYTRTLIPCRRQAAAVPTKLGRMQKEAITDSL